MDREGEASRPIVEEVEGLARIHGKEQRHPSEPLADRGDGFRSKKAIDLVPENAAPIPEDHAEFTNGSDLRFRRIKLKARRGDGRHRLHRVDALETEPPQGVSDEGIGRADDVAVRRKPGQRRNVEMVGMAVRDDENVDRRKPFRIDDALGTGRDRTFLEGIGEHRVHQAGGTRQFYEHRSMTEERNLHGDQPRGPICTAA